MRLHEGDIITFGGPKLVQSTTDPPALRCSNPHTYTVCDLHFLLVASPQAQEETQQLMPPAEDLLPVSATPKDNGQHDPVLRDDSVQHAQAAMLLHTSSAAEELQQTRLPGGGSSLEHSAEQGASGIAQHSIADTGPQLGVPAVKAASSVNPNPAAYTSLPAAEGSASPNAGGAVANKQAAEHTSAAPALGHASSISPDSAQNVTTDKAPPDLVGSAASPDAKAAAGTHAAAGSLEYTFCPRSAATAAADSFGSVIEITEVSSFRGPCSLSVKGAPLDLGQAVHASYDHRYTLQRSSSEQAQSGCMLMCREMMTRLPRWHPRVCLPGCLLLQHTYGRPVSARSAA